MAETVVLMVKAETDLVVAAMVTKAAVTEAAQLDSKAIVSMNTRLDGSVKPAFLYSTRSGLRMELVQQIRL